MKRSSKTREVRNFYFSRYLHLTPRVIEALVLLFSDYIRPVRDVWNPRLMGVVSAV
jgi:hypothetical protein